MPLSKSPSRNVSLHCSSSLKNHRQQMWPPPLCGARDDHRIPFANRPEPSAPISWRATGSAVKSGYTNKADCGWEQRVYTET
jgi:hypothetical protein